jgi:NAD(P)-dependent dehydrogenase (short-subunit alcohol dehydrogenase family)
MTSKAGMNGIMNATALDYGSRGIRANTICPGATAADMLKNAMKAPADAQKTDVYGAAEPAWLIPSDNAQISW